eukprot:m.5145 g.5145  ORF g.5145 m.5145 type:complete len:398 (+) comp3225_c0_seq1:386-1579(+)
MVDIVDRAEELLRDFSDLASSWDASSLQGSSSLVSERGQPNEGTQQNITANDIQIRESTNRIRQNTLEDGATKSAQIATRETRQVLMSLTTDEQESGKENGSKIRYAKEIHKRMETDLVRIKIGEESRAPSHRNETGLSMEDLLDVAQNTKKRMDSIKTLDNDDIIPGEQILEESSIRSTRHISPSRDYTRSLPRDQTPTYLGTTEPRSYSDLENKAATRIQAAWRGFLCRATDLQCATIRREIRTRRCEKQILMVSGDTESLKEKVRRGEEIRRLQQQAIGMLWKEVRRMKLDETARINQERERAAIIIQKHWRGRLARIRYGGKLKSNMLQKMSSIQRLMASVQRCDISSIAELCLRLQDQVDGLSVAVSKLSGASQWTAALARSRESHVHADSE